MSGGAVSIIPGEVEWGNYAGAFRIRGSEARQARRTPIHVMSSHAEAPPPPTRLRQAPRFCEGWPKMRSSQRACKSGGKSYRGHSRRSSTLPCRHPTPNGWSREPQTENRQSAGPANRGFWALPPRSSEHALRQNEPDLCNPREALRRNIRCVGARWSDDQANCAGIQARNIQKTFETAGIEFIGTPEEGPGIRLWRR